MKRQLISLALGFGLAASVLGSAAPASAQSIGIGECLGIGQLGVGAGTCAGVGVNPDGSLGSGIQGGAGAGPAGLGGGLQGGVGPEGAGVGGGVGADAGPLHTGIGGEEGTGFGE